MKGKNEVILIVVASEEEKRGKEKPLQILSANLSAEALQFLAEISQKQGAERKLLASRILINAFI